MGSELKKKAIGMFVVEVVALVILGVVLFAMQTGLSLRNQRESTSAKLREVEAILEQGALEEFNKTQRELSKEYLEEDEEEQG